MKDYVAFFYGKKITIRAWSMNEAKQKAIEHFKPKKKDRNLIAVVLADSPEAVLT